MVIIITSSAVNEPCGSILERGCVFLRNASYSASVIESVLRSQVAQFVIGVLVNERDTVLSSVVSFYNGEGVDVFESERGCLYRSSFFFYGKWNSCSWRPSFGNKAYFIKKFKRCIPSFWPSLHLCLLLLFCCLIVVNC